MLSYILRTWLHIVVTIGWLIDWPFFSINNNIIFIKLVAQQQKGTKKQEEDIIYNNGNYIYLIIKLSYYEIFFSTQDNFYTNCKDHQ